MATPATTATDYCTVLVKSRLLPAEEVDALYRRWKEERPGSDTRVDSFRRFLVARKALTDYQAALVQRGHADGFFLADYRILDQIGKGQMGGVYKAAHASGQVVALKILPASKAKNLHTLGRFQREARLLTQLDHPNVVRAFQVGEDGGRHYIVMEYLEGETLDEVLDRRTRLPAAEAARLMRQALDGLQHLHERRMVHRDVKPANMMLTREDDFGKPDTTWDATLKIVDIGLGRELFDEEMPEAQIDTQLTQEGSVLGTPDYLAPEQAKDARSADVRADIYSVGCVLYHCLTGRPPFPETNIMTQMVKHATEKPAPLSAFVDDLPPGFQEVVDVFLAKRPGDRYQTPAEASAALAPFAIGGAPPSSARLVPAFQDWLASESQVTRAKEQRESAKTDELPTPSGGQSSKPAGTGTKTALALGAVKTSDKTVAAEPVKSDTAPQPAKHKGGTRPAPALKPAPLPLPPAPPEEVDVELVAEPGLLPQPVELPAPAERPLWPPDRRDWLMLAAGATGVLAAVGLGYGLARALRRKPEGEE